MIVFGNIFGKKRSFLQKIVFGTQTVIFGNKRPFLATFFFKRRSFLHRFLEKKIIFYKRSFLAKNDHFWQRISAKNDRFWQRIFAKNDHFLQKIIFGKQKVIFGNKRSFLPKMLKCPALIMTNGTAGWNWRGQTGPQFPKCFEASQFLKRAKFGYFFVGPKLATLAPDSSYPEHWRLLEGNAGGRIAEDAGWWSEEGINPLVPKSYYCTSI